MPSNIPGCLYVVALACALNREMSTPAVKLEAKPKTVTVAADEQIKEVSMEVAGSSSAEMEGGGGGKTRRRRRGSRRQKGGSDDGSQPSSVTAVVEKEGTTPPVASTVAASASAVPVPAPAQTGGAKKAPVVVIAPPKKKAPKVTLVPKVNGKRAPVKKTFKAKRVRVLIKNRKTIKRQQQALQKVDSMTEVEVRTAAVSAGLTREKANAPVELLRKMLRDYQTMRGGFL